MQTSKSAPGYNRTVGSELTVQPVTIANGASLSAGIDLANETLIGIHMPGGWDAANLTFQASEDGVTYDNLYDASGTEKAVTAGASRYIYTVPSDWTGIRYLKVRSGTAAAAVNQTAVRTIKLITKGM